MTANEGALRSFKHRNFRIFFTVNMASNIGTWAQRVAQDWLVVSDLHKGGSELGIVTGLQFLPMLLFSLYAGSLADRLDKRKLLIITNAGGGATAAIMGWLIISHRVNLTEVFILAFALGVFGALDAPVRQAFTSELVGKSDIANAVSLNSANFNLGRLIGPAVSGILIKYFHTGPSFLLNAGTFLFVLVGLVRMRPDDLHRLPRDDKDRKIIEGLRYIKSRHDLVAIIATVFFASTFGLNFQIFNALISTKIFHKDAGAFGLLGSVLAIGSLSAAIVSTRLDQKRKPPFIMTFSALFGLLLIGQAYMPNYLTFALMLPLCGFFALTTMISANTYIQTTTPHELRGRVMGFYLLIFLGATPIGSPFIGWLADVAGVRATVAICGAITTLGALLIYLLMRKRLLKYTYAA
ncbi:MAG: MFS transporter [Actinomycetes bacterium]|jgi:MFS family permease